jgi:hypothetical protein
VLDTGFRPLTGARIEVLDGPQRGATATADTAGQFVLSGTFDGNTRFRATKDGHVAATQVWNCSVPACAQGAKPWLGFYLNPTVTPVDLGGEYTVTFIADSACSDLPAEARTRTYAATIARDSSAGPNGSASTSMTATLRGGSFLGSLDSFPVGLAGDYADFWLHGGHDPAVVEQLAPNTYLAFSGNAPATVGTRPPKLSMLMDGWIEYCVSSSPLGKFYTCGKDGAGTVIAGAAITRARCDSPNHQLIWTRR